MLPTALQKQLRLLGSGLESVPSANKILSFSEHYKLGDVHIVDVIDEVYVFCKINYILKVGSSWHFCGKLLFSNSFSKRLHSYSVHETDMWHAVKLGAQLSGMC